MLTIQTLQASYDGVPALHDVTMEVGAGEYVGVIGPNGAGKTTTVKCISGTVAATGGSITFDGVDVLDLSGHERVDLGIVHVPQGRRVFPSLSVLENLQMGAFREAARPDMAARLDYSFELFPVLEDLRELAAGSLSGGQQQMLAVARGLMAKPRLLMLDEPSMGLAPVIVEEIFDALEQLRSSEDMSVLLVEQLAHEAMDLCERLYVLESGEVVTHGPTAELLSDDQVVEAYLGQG